MSTHLERIRQVAERIEPGLMSEHLAWSVVGGTYLADLLPLPMTEEALDTVCRHVDQTQSYLKRRFFIENPSTYLQFGHSTIPEWEFMAAVAATHRLRHPLRRQQYLRQRPQPRLGCSGLSGCPAARRDRRNPFGGPFSPSHA